MTSSLQSSLPNLLAFCASYEAGSFSRAARELGQTPQATSRSVVRLEDTLGVALFRRTTRTVTPTAAAHSYYQFAKQALELLHRAEQDLSGQAGAGTVRISAPTTFAHHVLLPAMPAFSATYPNVTLEVDIDNHNTDFTRAGHDLAVRLGQIRDKGLVSRRLGHFPVGVYAAPAYLNKHPAVRRPAQLVDHSCLGFVMPSSGRILPWGFTEPRSWTPDSPIRCGGDPLALVTLARAGMGLVQMYDFIVATDVAQGNLVEVLRDYRAVTRPFSLVYPAAKKPSPTARLLIEFLLRRT